MSLPKWKVETQSDCRTIIRESSAVPTGSHVATVNPMRKDCAELLAAAPEYHEAAKEAWLAWIAVPFNQERMIKAMSELSVIVYRFEPAPLTKKEAK